MNAIFSFEILITAKTILTLDGVTYFYNLYTDVQHRFSLNVGVGLDEVLDEVQITVLQRM